MGRRRKHRKGEQAAGAETGDEEDEAQTKRVYNSTPPDPPVRLIALHPTGGAVAVAIGVALRVYDRRANCLAELIAGSTGAQHAAPIHVLQFDPTGRLLLSGGVDKVLKLWDTTTWACTQTLKAAKKISAAAFTPDGAYVLYGDKFGDVLVAPTAVPAAGAAPKAELLLGHFCSILTSICVSPDKRFVVTTDRDSKIRVTKFPSDPMQGAHEIQSYCLAHSAFVSSSAFISFAGTTRLLTAGGDGTLRLWDHVGGELLQTLQLTAAPAAGAPTSTGNNDSNLAHVTGEQQQEGRADAAELQPGLAPKAASAELPTSAAMVDGDAIDAGAPDSDGGEGSLAIDEPDTPAVVAIAVHGGRNLVAAAVEGSHSISTVEVDLQTNQLQVLQQLQLPGLELPTDLAFGAGGQLFVVGGPLVERSEVVHLAIATADEAEGWKAVAIEEVLPAAAAAVLVGTSEPGGGETSSAAVSQVHVMLKKRALAEYEDDRKRNRADLRVKAALLELAAASQQQN